MDRGDLWEAQHNLIYNYNGGLSLSDVKKMRKKKFIWSLKRLAKQKKDENEAIKKANASMSKPSTKGKRYLGKM
jgi:hypothetical protein